MNYVRKNGNAAIFLDPKELSGDAPGLPQNLASLSPQLRRASVKIHAKDSVDISLWALSTVAAFAAGIRSGGGRTSFVGGKETVYALEQLGFSSVFDTIETGEQ